jgi:hypothetical protein
LTPSLSKQVSSLLVKWPWQPAQVKIHNAPYSLSYLVHPFAHLLALGIAGLPAISPLSFVLRKRLQALLKQRRFVTVTREMV